MGRVRSRTLCTSLAHTHHSSNHSNHSEALWWVRGCGMHPRVVRLASRKTKNGTGTARASWAPQRPRNVLQTCLHVWWDAYEHEQVMQCTRWSHPHAQPLLCYESAWLTSCAGGDFGDELVNGDLFAFAGNQFCTGAIRHNKAR